MARKRKKPLRKCIVTKEMKAKDDLIRIVRTKDGEVFIDPTGKQNGRGAYLSINLKVIEEAQKRNILREQLKVDIPENIYDQLKEMVEE